MLTSVADRLEQALDRFKLLLPFLGQPGHLVPVLRPLLVGAPVRRIITAPRKDVFRSDKLTGGGVAGVVPLQRLLAPSGVVLGESVKRLLQLKADADLVTIFMFLQLFVTNRPKAMSEGHFPFGIRPLVALVHFLIKISAGSQALPDVLLRPLEVDEVALLKAPNTKLRRQYLCWRQRPNQHPYQKKESGDV